MTEVKKHVFARDKNGKIWKWDEDTHSGPYCLGCKIYICESCRPQCWTDACPVQEDALFDLELLVNPPKPRPPKGTIEARRTLKGRIHQI